MTSTVSPITAAASKLYDAHRNRVPCPPVSTSPGLDAVSDAYAVQMLNTERWIDEGRRVVGCKIGLTSPAVQQQLGVDQPDYGLLFSDMSIDDGGQIAPGLLIQPRVEAEVAFVLGRDLPEHDTTIAEVLGAIEFVVAAIEIVDSRVKDWAITIVDTIADNASSGLFALGSRPVRIDAFDPVSCEMTMTRAGETVSTGQGRACLGSPVSATAWLARTMAGVGRPLRQGDVVLSGALGPMVPARPGDRFEAVISGLGSVSVSFATD